MLIPVKFDELPLENRRAISDLVQNATSKEYYNVKGFKQKYIDLLFKLGYYKNNESVFSIKGEK